MKTKPGKDYLKFNIFCIDISLPTTNVGDGSLCTATIRSKVDEAIKLEVVLKIEPNGRIRTPIRALSGSMVKKFRELPLAAVPSTRNHLPDPWRGRLP